MVDLIRKNPHLFWAAIILLFALGMTFFGPNNRATYQASYEQENQGDVVGSYDDLYNFNEDTIGNSLLDANRRQGEALYGRRYVHKNLSLCTSEEPEFVCSEDERYFADPYGCGCERASKDNEETEEGVEGVDETTVYPVIYGEVARLRTSDSIELNAGDALWVREFVKEEDMVPQVIFDIYIAGEDLTYQYPDDAGKLLYELELVSSDYSTYVEIIISQKGSGQKTATSTATTSEN